VGSTRSAPDAHAVVDEHDRVSRAMSDLPLASFFAAIRGLADYARFAR